MTEAEIEKLTQEYKRSAQMLLRRDLELSKANAQLQQLDQDKSEFVSIAAHQLRTPLTAISWSQRMLLDEDDGKLNDEQRDLLQKSQSSINRMLALINDLLSADHLEYGQVRYEKFDHNLGLIAKTAVDELQPLAQDKKIKLNFIPADHTIKMCCDSGKLKEALANLINNAIKYTLPEGMVTVKLEETDSNFVITVKDTGVGIPKKHMGNLFKKFSRADNAKRIDADGSGLGLFIVNKIIQAHYGTVEIASEEGVGTTISLVLPKQVTCDI